MSLQLASRARRRARRVGLEPLEGRTLLSGFTEYPLAKPTSSQFVQVHDIVAVGDSSVEVATTQYGAADPRTGQPTYQGTSLFQATSSGSINPIHNEGDSTRSAIYGLVKGADGNLWGIVNYAPARLNGDGSITRFPLANGNYAQAIAAGPDGALWFTEPYHGLVAGAPAGSVREAIGRITTTGTITESLLPSNAAKPDQIAVGPDGAMWFTLNDFGVGSAAPMIGRIPIGLGTVTEYAVPNTATLPHSITTGPDGNLWFTAQGIAKGAGPTVNSGLNYIGRVNAAGAVTMFPLPPQTENQKAGFVLGGITPGPDGNIWFTEPKSGQIARINPSGTVTEFPVPTKTSAPNDITLGRDGALWFTELLGNQIGRYQPGPDLQLSASAPVAVLNSGFSGVVASLTDNTPSISSSYSAVIDWGDGSGPQPGVVTGNGSQLSVVGGHTYSKTGTFSLIVTVREPSGEMVSSAGSVTVRGGSASSAHFIQARRSPLQIAISYDGPMDNSVAVSASRYSVVSLGRANRRGVRPSRNVNIKSISYNTSTHTVYLTLRGAVARAWTTQVRIAGEGTVTVS